MVTLWFDKDGVLATYDYSLYEPEFDAPAPWLVRNAHVYRNLDTYENMCEAFRRLYRETYNVKPEDRICNMRVLSSVSNSVTLSEHVMDSILWCQEKLGLKARDYYATAVSKVDIPVSLHVRLTSQDVLLDDYKPNLLEWREAGGTAVKIVNDINSMDSNFPCIRNDAGSQQIYDMLRMIVRTCANGTVHKGDLSK